jgi:deoxycytidylate deaminase
MHKFQYQRYTDTLHRVKVTCNIVVSGEVVATGVGGTDEEARKEALLDLPAKPEFEHIR